MGHDHEGQRVSRRTALAGISSIGLGALLAACGKDGASGGTGQATTTTGASASVSPQAVTTEDLTALFANAGTCTLTAETTQGPYYFDADKIRSDIREDRAGKQLRLAIRVQDSESCAAVPNAVVEIWHCDAGGVYSEYANAMNAGSATSTFLRGYQATDANGQVTFTTVYPGWYAGRVTHIHVEVFASGDTATPIATTQIAFPEAVSAAVYATSNYSAHGQSPATNAGDMVFADGDAYELASIAGSAASAYTATLAIGVST